MAKAKYKKRPDGRYATIVWDGTYKDGKKHYIWLYSTKSSRDLENKRMEYIAARKEGKNVVKSDMTLQEYAEKWLGTYKSNREKNTYAMYERIIKKHLGDAGKLPVDRLTSSLVQTIINGAADRPRTCQQLSLTIKQVIRAAERDRLLPRGASLDLLSDISLPRYIPSEKRALTAQEKDAISKADLTPRERAFVLTLFYTGMRRGEALALTPFDLSFSAETITISKSLAFDDNTPYIKGTKSHNGMRTVPMPPALAACLKEYAKTIKGAQLFGKLNGEPMTKSSYVKMWDSIRGKLKDAYIAQEQAGKVPGDLREPVNWLAVGFEDLTAHTFRHNYCTSLCYKMVQSGNISFKKIAALMGDTEKMVIEVYNHIMEEKEDVAAVVMDAVVL